MVSRRTLLVVGAPLVAAAAIAGTALASASPATTGYRTAVVRRAAVSETLHRPGTIEPVAKATVAFPIAGTVASVGVHVGDTVETGTVLAILDTTSLQSALAAKQAVLANAKLTLQKALDSQATTTTTTAPAPAASTGTQALKQQVADDQKRVDAAAATARAAVADASHACSSSSGGGSSTSTSTSTSTSSTTSTTTDASTTSTTSTTAPPSGTSSSSSACSAAQDKALNAEEALLSAESALASHEAALDKALSSTQSSSTHTGSAAPTGGSSAARTTPASAEDLVADQAAVDAAAADVAVAQQNLAEATAVSPMPGIVVAVGLSAGRQVSAASSSAAIVVEGQGGFEVSTTVNASDIGSVRMDAPATVLPDGTSTPLTGKVVAIGVDPTTSATTPTYPVVVGFDGTPAGLRDGVAASVSIEVARSVDAVTVPTSAVHGLGVAHVVNVLTAGKVTALRVQVGAVGAELTEITSGLTVGQVVVIADLNEPVPSATTNSRLIGGGFGGGGLGTGGGGLGGGGLGTRRGG
jgi:HlyD family secretion protein